ncbi:CYFA0S19e00562g1_1 [Cyberlindnera fabianii]|uniref:CYFA0S19e00562g1_1 n=1 Tax=Cyberlindnera fabianii TaxID=36022 RepID=A0A061B890_CYBFA|nr:CYFA0S19e00562g1_1 [Cyberlindnera fabianii]
MVQIEAQQWILNKYATFSEEVNLNYDTEDATFKLITKKYDTESDDLLKDGEVLVENLYLSNDPAQKGWFTPYKSYVPPVPLGSVAPAQGLGRVIKSKSDKFAEGDLISARSIGWSTHNIINADGPMVQKPDASKVPHITKYLSAFGTTTLTAYFTAFHYSGIKPEDEGKVWLISGAAGAAGSSLVQIVSHLFKPKKIIAIAGGADKCKWVESLGNGIIALDYKSETYKDDFTKALGDDLINVFADHVGGWILNHAISYMQTFGKIVQIGSIASYNDNTKFIFNNYSSVISKRLTIQGMVLVDHIPEIPTVVGELIKYFSTGKLDINNFTETIVDAQGDKFKDVPKLWTGLFTGANRGKFITQVGKY